MAAVISGTLNPLAVRIDRFFVSPFDPLKEISGLRNPDFLIRVNGLLLVTWFNGSRSHGVPLQEALIDGIEKRVRPLTMTALTAIFGLLTSAVSTQIGSETTASMAIVSLPQVVVSVTEPRLECGELTVIIVVLHTASRV